MIKRRLLGLTKSPVVSGVLNALERADSNGKHILRVLTYHRVDEPDAQPHLSPSILSATPDDFHTQMRFVTDHYTPVSAQQVLGALETGAALPPKAILVTFDDAYRDFAQHAWPILQQYQIPAVLFVPTAYPDNPQRMLWWDRLHHAVQQTTELQVVIDGAALPLTTPAERKHAFKQARASVKALPHTEGMQLVDALCDELGVAPYGDNNIMGWDDLKQLAADGVTLGAHTVTHPLLNRVSVDEAEREAVDSLRELERRIGDTLPVFAYPSGGANETIAARLAQAGFKLAFTTVRGINDLAKANPLLLNRINVGGSTSLNIMRAQLLGQMAYVDRLRG